MIGTDTSPFVALPWQTEGGHYCLIAGPCSAESEHQTLSTAHALSALGVGYYRASLWKPRTRPGGFEGVGHIGLPWLRRVAEETGMQVMTEVATPAHIEAVRRAGIKHIWIGARTSSSPFAMAEIAEALHGDEEVSVLVKNPINPDLNLWEGALLRLHAVGVQNIGAIHRGFSTYGENHYRNSPIWQIPIELKLRHPQLTIVVDPSHIGGKRSLIEPLARTALDMHFDGLMIETHCQPSEALSDAQQQISPEELGEIIRHLGTAPTEGASSPELEMWRSEINRIDDEVLALLARRQDVARQIGRYKHEQNMCIVQPERYRELIRSREERAVELGLGAEYVHELFSRIHSESVRLQQTL